MAEWEQNLVDTEEGIAEILESAKRIAVLGIKPESRGDRPAHYVPAYLAGQGYEIVPVPVYYPEVQEILGQRVFRSVAAVPGPIDVVCVFRRPKDIPPHVPDIIAAAPRAVWMQSGITHDEVAETLARAGIRVVQDRCMMVEHRRWRSRAAE